MSEHHPLIPPPDGELREPNFLEKPDVEGGAPGCLILLFERDGRLAELEFAPMRDGPYEIPPAEEVEVYLD